jgi:hypothetical protein
MKVLFLDIDPVLNSDAWYARAGRPAGELGHFDPELVRNVDELAARTGAAVVISSAWRVHFGLEELRSILLRAGLAAPVIDVTPIVEDGALDGLVRSAEIMRWLAEHTLRSCAGAVPTVRRFAILDDLRDFGPLAPWHVRTSEEHGVMHEDVERAAALLGDACAVAEAVA